LKDQDDEYDRKEVPAGSQDIQSKSPERVDNIR